MRLKDCPDIDRDLIGFFAAVLAGKSSKEITSKEFERLDTERPSCINRSSDGYRVAQATADKMLRDLQQANYA